MVDAAMVGMVGMVDNINLTFTRSRSEWKTVERSVARKQSTLITPGELLRAPKLENSIILSEIKVSQSNFVCLATNDNRR